MKRQSGFTLVNVLATMAISVVALSIGAPSLQSYIQNSRKTTSINEMATALQLARNSAISQRILVTLCKSDDGINCEIGAGSDWSQGWMLYTNPNNIDATAGFAGAETLLRVHDALPGSSTTFIGTGPTANRVSFTPQGLVSGNIGTITHCDSRGANYASALVISFGGQVRLAEDTNGDGIVENGTGNPVPCPP